MVHMEPIKLKKTAEFWKPLKITDGHEHPNIPSILGENVSDPLKIIQTVLKP